MASMIRPRVHEEFRATGFHGERRGHKILQAIARNARAVVPGRSRSGFRAQSPDRFLELTGRQVEVGFNFGCEVGVMLEAEAVSNDLEGKPFRDQAAGEKHPVAPEELLGPEPGGAFNGIFQLPVCEIERLGYPGDRKLFCFSKFKQVLPVRAPEVLAFAGDLKLRGIFSHTFVQN